LAIIIISGGGGGGGGGGRLCETVTYYIQQTLSDVLETDVSCY